MPPCTKCPDPAGAFLGFSYQARTAWLEDLDVGFDRFTDYPLCRSHADRFVAPSGWMVHDRRAGLGPSVIVARAV